MIEPIVKTIEVACDPGVAFETFVNRIAKWWPLDGHAVSAASGKAALAVTIEPHVGGAVYETMYDGTRTDWGTVQTFNPPAGFSMTWHPGTNKDNPTHVAVAFEAVGAGQTRVTLTHSGWEAWKDRAGEMRANYNGGWVNVFETCFANACKAS